MGKGIVQTDQYILFWGGWPSQWYPADFEVADVRYNCCEQYMMAEKARVFGDDTALDAILASTNPREQKALGRTVANFDKRVWDSVCRGIVYSANLARFAQDATLREVLLDTGQRTIVEASPVDRIWGIGLATNDPRAQDPTQWRGRNWLGIALMQVRDALGRGTSEQPAEPTEADLLEQLARRRERSVGVS